MYCSSVSSPLTHLPFAFYVPLRLLHAIQHSDSSPSPPPFSPLSSLLQHFSPIFSHFVCHKNKMHKYKWIIKKKKKKKKKKHYTLMSSSYLKASFGGMIWLCMYRSVLTLMFSLCSSPQHSSFRTPSCELKGSSRCECVCVCWVSGQSSGKRGRERKKKKPREVSLMQRAGPNQRYSDILDLTLYPPPCSSTAPPTPFSPIWNPTHTQTHTDEKGNLLSHITG